MSSSPRINGLSTSIPDLPAGNSVSRENTKRGLDETQAQTSPVRRSKRLKSGEALNVPSQTAQSAAGLKQEDSSQSPRSSASKKRKQEKTEATSVKREIKEEENETGLSMTVTPREQAQPNTKEPDQKATVTAKVSRKRKTKEEKEIEMQPLAARTNAMRMLVGAHVSAAKGESPCPYIYQITHDNIGIFNAVSNSTHVGYASLP